MANKLITLTLLLLFFYNVHAQDVIAYDYDDTGNIIGRYVTSSLNDEDYKDILIGDSVNYSDDYYKISVYPSPTKGPLFINIENYAQNGMLNVVNTSNGSVTHFDFIGDSLTVDISNLPKGVYILNFILGYMPNTGPYRNINSVKILKE